MKILCCIPARFASTRLNGKLLFKINDKTVIQLVYEQVKKCELISDIIVVTDNDAIKKEIIKIGGKSVIVNDNCLNGTERIVNYLQQFNPETDIIVNVQGDEPFINPKNIDLCIQNYIDNSPDTRIKCSTLHYKMNVKNVGNRSRPKLVIDRYNNILYCSRNIIPSSKNGTINSNYQYLGHIGVFVFDKKYLMNEYLENNSRCQLEEDIEWLKILEDGYKINSVLVNDHERGIDTIRDYYYLTSKYGS